MDLGFAGFGFGPQGLERLGFRIEGWQFSASAVTLSTLRGSERLLLVGRNMLELGGIAWFTMPRLPWFRLLWNMSPFDIPALERILGIPNPDKFHCVLLSVSSLLHEDTSYTVGTRPVLSRL